MILLPASRFLWTIFHMPLKSKPYSHHFLLPIFKDFPKGQNPTNLENICTVLLLLFPFSYFSHTFWKSVSASCLLSSPCILCAVLCWKQCIYLHDECASIEETGIPTQPLCESFQWTQCFLLPGSENPNSAAVIMYVYISSSTM